jgi:hypothetical protein
LFNLIIVYNFDRLFRTAFEYAILKTILEGEHVQLDYVTEPMVDSDGMQDFVKKHLVIVPIAKFYRRNISCEPVVAEKADRRVRSA